MYARSFFTAAVLSAVALGAAGCAAGPAGEPFGAQPAPDLRTTGGGMYADYEAFYAGTLESARFAQDRTQNEALREYSQRLIDDYTAARERLRPLMQRHGITAMPGTTSQALQRGFRESGQALRTYEGTDFDRQWLGHHIAMNRWLLENIDRSYAPGVQRNADLSSELTALRSVVQAQLEEAERIRAGIQ